MMSKPISMIRDLFRNKNASVEVFSAGRRKDAEPLSGTALSSVSKKMGLASLPSIVDRIVDMSNNGVSSVSKLIKDSLSFDSLPDALDTKHLGHIKNQIIDSVSTVAVLPLPLKHLKPDTTGTIETLKNAYMEGSSLVHMNGSEVSVRLIAWDPDAIEQVKAMLPGSLHELIDLAKDMDIDAISFSTFHREMRMLPEDGIPANGDRGHRLELVGMLKHEIYSRTERTTTISASHLSERDIELLKSADDGSVTKTGHGFKIELGNRTEKSDRHLKKHSQELQDIITAARAVGVKELTFGDVAPLAEANEYEDLRGESRFQIR